MSLNVSSDVRTPGSPSLPDGGISMVRAVQLAREHAGESCQLVMASGGRAGCVYTTPTGARTAGLAPDRLVWVVTFRGGHLPTPSPALRSPLPCYSPRTGTLTVVLDYFTGAFLEASPRVERRLPAAYVLAGRTTARRSFERG
jgi:hypothetical protein